MAWNFGVCMCDFCGKRIDRHDGNLILVEREDSYKRKTIRSWALCKACLMKLSGLKSFGDKIKEDMELALDRLRSSNNNFVLLDNDFGNLKNNSVKDLKKIGKK